ncbi:MAG TPA: hypothetical protein QGF58_30040 [Myxococcota bacterium]|nr:hypothetical protein [Myxococcota bacterium]
MSRDNAKKTDETPLPELDGLDLPKPEHVPGDLEDLYEEDVSDEITDVDRFDVPEPRNLEPQGYLPPPDHPKDDSLVEQRVRETGCVLLSTDEEAIRAHMLYEGTRTERDLDRGEDALLRWRLKSGQRQREHAERTAFENAGRRKAVGSAMFVGLVLGGSVWVAVLLGDATTQPESPLPELTPAVLAAVAAPVVVPPVITEVDGGTLVEVQTELWTPPVIEGSYRSWDNDGHRFWQFDFASEDPMNLRWVDPAGEVRLDDTVCDNRIDGATGRCYVGRNIARFADAPDGEWTLVGCLDARCGPVSTFEF